MLSASAASTVAYALIRFLPSGGQIYHVIIAGSFFTVYTGLSLVRRETRETLQSIWVSIISRKKNE
jgi:hypothetical protein